MSAGLFSSLRAELSSLRAALRSLITRTDQLERRVEEAEQSGFDLISDAPSEPARETEARSEVTRSSQSSAGRTVETEDTEGRVALAKELGQFLRRCLSGEPRGSSGRDRLRLQNRFYIVCADYHGRVLPEPLFLDNFATVRGLCKQGSSAGQSIFLGVATKWEARIVFREAGLRVPETLRHD